MQHWARASWQRHASQEYHVRANGMGITAATTLYRHSLVGAPALAALDVTSRKIIIEARKKGKGSMGPKIDAVSAASAITSYVADFFVVASAVRIIISCVEASGSASHSSDPHRSQTKTSAAYGTRRQVASACAAFSSARITPPRYISQASLAPRLHIARKVYVCTSPPAGKQYNACNIKHGR